MKTQLKHILSLIMAAAVLLFSGTALAAEADVQKTPSTEHTPDISTEPAEGTVEPIAPEGKKALIVIPGITGSELYSGEPSASTKMWVGPGLLQYEKLICLPDGTSDPSAEIIAYDDPDDDTYGPMGVYDELMTSLQTQLTENGGEYDEIAFFAYDWRLTNSLSAEKLGLFIKEKGYTDVTLIGHSMGGIVALLYIDAAGQACPVDKLVTLGTPFFGAPKALFALETGNYLDSGSTITQGIPVSRAMIKSLVISMPGVYELICSQDYFANDNTYVYIQNAIDSAAADYEDIVDIMAARDWFNSRIYADAEGLYAGTDVQTALSNCDAYIVSGYGTPTVTSLRWTENGGSYVLSDLNVSIDGDGTVPVASSAMLGTAADRRPFFVSNVSHMELVSDAEVLTLVENILSGTADELYIDETVVTDGETVAISREIDPSELSRELTGDYLRLTVTGSATVTVKDESGATILTSTADTASSNENVYAFSAGTDGSVQIAYMDDGVYSVTIKAVSAGDVKIKLQRFSGSGNELYISDRIELDRSETAVFSTAPENGVITVSARDAEYSLENIPEGWSKLRGSWVYSRNNDLLTGLQTVTGYRKGEAEGENQYLFDGDGALYTGFKKIDGHWRFFGEQGHSPMSSTLGQMIKDYYVENPENGYRTASEKAQGKVYRYYFDEEGRMFTGWYNSDLSFDRTGNWRYFIQKGSSPETSRLGRGCRYGVISSEFCTGNNGEAHSYFFSGTGGMMTGIKTIHGQDVFFNTAGVDPETDLLGAAMS